MLRPVMVSVSVTTMLPATTVWNRVESNGTRSPTRAPRTSTTGDARSGATRSDSDGRIACITGIPSPGHRSIAKTAGGDLGVVVSGVASPVALHAAASNAVGTQRVLMLTTTPSGR